jgi:hypothetical protein
MLINVVDAADWKFCLPLRFLVAEIRHREVDIERTPRKEGPSRADARTSNSMFNIQFEGRLDRALVEISDCRLLMAHLGW